MTVYVDELRLWGPSPYRCFYTGSSHLTADSADELHAFAAAIGPKRSWAQTRSIELHYDLSPGMRLKAIAAGAVFVPAMEQARLALERKRAKASGGQSPPTNTDENATEGDAHEKR